MTRVYWDSMLFIYMLEEHPAYCAKALKILKQAMDRGNTLCTSVFTVGEVLTGPRRLGSVSGVQAVKRYFESGAVELLPFTLTTADQYGVIRSSHRVAQADAIHLASAAEAGVDIFFTNDGDLRGLSIPGIKFFADLDGRVI